MRRFGRSGENTWATSAAPKAKPVRTDASTLISPVQLLRNTFVCRVKRRRSNQLSRETARAGQTDCRSRQSAHRSRYMLAAGKLKVTIAVELLTLVWGTVIISNPAVNNSLMVLAWLVSLVSAFLLLATSIKNNKRQSLSVFRTLAVSALILVIVFTSAMLAPLVHMP